MRRTAPVLLLPALVLASCSLGTDPFVVQVGAINQASIVTPDTVTAGQPFQVSFRTVGADGCWGRERTEVAVSGMTASITPYDRILTDGGCAPEPVSIDHAASVTLTTPGDGLLRFVGLNSTVERSVVVR